MSTSPETAGRADDRIVTVLSRWLARHADDDELVAGVTAVDTAELSPAQAEAVEELLAEFDAGGSSADREMLVRETLEAVALG
jgi:hypothetical protein